MSEDDDIDRLAAGQRSERRTGWRKIVVCTITGAVIFCALRLLGLI